MISSASFLQIYYFIKEIKKINIKTNLPTVNSFLLKNKNNQKRKIEKKQKKTWGVTPVYLS